jgi:parvulin-like peptidyl-prolyl isomerase
VGPETADEKKVDLRKRIEDAAARLKAKDPFEIVAREVSDGSSANWGGELGCLGEGYGVGSKELLEAVSKMKPGEVSPVLETARGFHIVKLRGKLAEKDVEKVGRLAVARRLAVALNADALTKKFADEVIERAQKGEKLDDVVKELAKSYLQPFAAAKKDEEPKALQADNRPRVEISAPFNQVGGPTLDLTPGQNAAADVFALKKVDEVLKKPLTTTSGLAVLQLKEKTLAKAEDFEKDRLDVLGGLKSAKEREALARYLVELREKAKDKISIDPRILEDAKESDSDGS